MAKPIPDAATVAKKWKSNASGAQTEYVNNAKLSTWKTEAVAGEDNYKKAMADVIAKERRKKMIEKSSDAVWQKGIEDNAGRYSDGVNKAEGDMAAGMTPVLNDIKAEVPNLPKKGPKASAQNFERSKQLGMKLHDAAERRKS